MAGRKRTSRAPALSPRESAAVKELAARAEAEPIRAEIVELFASARAAQMVKRTKKLAASLGKHSALAVALFDTAARFLLEREDGEHAAQLLSLARRAERNAKLPIVVEEQWPTFHAFAARGALDPRDLQRLLKATMKRVPVETWLELVLVFLRGGGVPWDALLTDLEAGFKAHKIEPAARAQLVDDVMEALIASRGAASASLAFWRRTQALWGEKLRASAEAGRWALELLPRLGDHGVELASFWVALLRESGALEALGQGRIRVKGGVGAWLTAAMLWLHRVRNLSSAILECIDAVAPTLAATGVTWKVPERNSDGVDLVLDPDALDLLLAHGVDLAEPSADALLDLYAWVSRRKLGLRGAPLDALARDERWRARLERAFTGLMDTPASWAQDILREMLDAPALHWLFADWGRSVVGDIRDGTVLSAAHAIRSLSRFADVLHQAAPELPAWLRDAETALALARTLRSGVRDEWGWPAMDLANERLGGALHPHQQGGLFPVNVVHDDSKRAVVVGPDGVLAELRLPIPESARVQGTAWVDGDILCVFDNGSLEKLTVWGSAPQEVRKSDWMKKWLLAAPVRGGGVTTGGKVIRPGTFELEEMSRWTTVRLFSDGGRFYRFVPEATAPVAFDPQTGLDIPGALPSFLEPADDEVSIDWSASYWLPAPHPEESGLGRACQFDDAAVPMHGVRVARLANQRVRVTFADGRCWEGEGDDVVGAVAWPGTDALYPLRGEESRDAMVYTPDGRVLSPWRQRDYHRGTPQPVPFGWWGVLRPRDLAGSAALRALDDDVARELLESVRAVVEEASAARPDGDDLDDEIDPRVVGAVSALLPGVSHPRLVRGIAGIVLEALEVDSKLRVLRDAVGLGQRAVAADDDLRDFAASVLDAFVPRIPPYEDGHLGRQILEVLAFFRADAGPDASGGELRVQTISKSSRCWERVFAIPRALAWYAASVAVSDAGRAAVSTLFRLLDGFTELAAAGRLRYFIGRAGAYPVPALSPDNPQLLVATHDGRHRWLVRIHGGERGQVVLGGIEVRTGDTFLDLPGVTSIQSIPLEPLPASARDAVRLAIERGPFAIDAAEVNDALASGTGLGGAAVPLLWSGAVLGEVSEELRQALALSQAALAHGTMELAELPRLTTVYERALPEDAEQLWSQDAWRGEPSEDNPRERLIAAFCAVAGGPLPAVDSEVLARVADDFGADARPSRDLRLIAEPSRSAALTTDATFAIRPYRPFRSHISYMRGWLPAGWPLILEQPEGDERVPARVFTGSLLRDLVRYVPWLYQEQPVGDPLRAKLPPFCAMISARLDNPGLLLLAGAVDLSLEQDPAEHERKLGELLAPFIELPPYVSPDDRPVAPGVDRGDLVVTWPQETPNGIFLAVRPSRLVDATSLAELARTLGIDEAFSRSGGGGCTCGLRFGQHELTHTTELPALLVWRSPGFAQLMERVVQTPLAAGQYEADPRASAPLLVEAARGAHALSEDAATLWLQTLTLARPSRAHVQRYNGWAAARYRTAAQELLDKGLVEERIVPATGRDIFVRGEPIVEPLTRASPLELSKLSLYGLERDERGKITPPLGMVLPLDPLHTLFERAWRSGPGASP